MASVESIVDADMDKTLFWQGHKIGVWTYVRLNPLNPNWPYAFFVPIATASKVRIGGGQPISATVFKPTLYLSWATPCTGCGEYLAKLRHQTVSLCECQQHILCSDCARTDHRMFDPACVNTTYVKGAGRHG